MKIAKRPNSQFAGIYADEGITGTSTKKRKDFLRLMRDCEKGKVLTLLENLESEDTSWIDDINKELFEED